jgi:hypothetical protein
MKSVSKLTPATSQLLSALTDRIGKDNVGGWKSFEIAMALYGIQQLRIGPTEKVVQRALVALTACIAKCDSPFGSQEVANVLYSLKSKDSESWAVRELLEVFTHKLENEYERYAEALSGGVDKAISRSRLSGQAIANSLYGALPLYYDAVFPSHLRALLYHLFFVACL